VGVEQITLGMMLIKGEKMEDKKDYNKCLRCGRKLKTEEARKIGYGKICLEKIQKEKKGRLF